MPYVLGGQNELGKDKVIIYIKNVNIYALYSDRSVWETYSVEAFKDKYRHRVSYYKCGCKVCNIGVFNVNYLRYSSVQGDLLLSFSVAKFYNGNNSISKGNISTSDLTKRISNALSYVLCMDKLPPANTWRVIKDESNIDIIDSIENIQQRFDLIKKIKIPYRSIDYSLSEDGTIYFHSGKDRKKCSAAIIIYDKGKEQQFRGNDIHRFMEIDDDQEGLRIEVVGKGYSLKRKVKKANMAKDRSELYPIINIYRDLGTYNWNAVYNMDRSTTGEHDDNHNIIFKEMISIIYIKPKRYEPQLNYYLGWQAYIKCNMSNLSTVMSKHYQSTVINDFIVQCGFDKIITTKDKLYKIIENSSIFTKTKRKTAKKVIRSLNENNYNTPLNYRTIDIYKKLILSTGYHYLYADIELKPITLVDILTVIEQDKALKMIG